jgi:hypothetical protein
MRARREVTVVAVSLVQERGECVECVRRERVELVGGHAEPYTPTPSRTHHTRAADPTVAGELSRSDESMWSHMIECGLI